MDLHFSRLHSPDDPAFNAACSLYARAIPPSEQKPLSALRQMVHNPVFRFITAGSNSGQVLGMAIVFSAPSLALLEYLAVDAEVRSRGVGSALFRECIPSDRTRPLMVEVETPRPADPDSLARARFYRRLGCRLIDLLAYRLPLPGNPPPMQLHVYRDPPPQQLSKAVLRSILTTLYTRVYACPAGDPRIEGMLAPLPDPVLVR